MSVSQAQVKSSSRRCFLLTAEQGLVFRLDHRLEPVYCFGEKEGVHAKARFWCMFTPGVFFSFLPTYSLHVIVLSVSQNLTGKNSQSTR